VRLLRPMLDVVGMRIAQLGMTFGIQPHRERNGSRCVRLKMNRESLMRATIVAYAAM
jgi:hypothetical protein